MDSEEVKPLSIKVIYCWAQWKVDSISRWGGSSDTEEVFRESVLSSKTEQRPGWSAEHTLWVSGIRGLGWGSDCVYIFNVINRWMVKPTKWWQTKGTVSSPLCVSSGIFLDTKWHSRFKQLIVAQSLEWAVSSVRSLIQAVEMFNINTLYNILVSNLSFHPQWPALECHIIRFS